MIPAAMGAEADVPVWDLVHILCKSVLKVFLSSYVPLASFPLYQFIE